MVRDRLCEIGFLCGFKMVSRIILIELLESPLSWDILVLLFGNNQISSRHPVVKNGKIQQGSCKNSGMKFKLMELLFGSSLSAAVIIYR